MTRLSVLVCSLSLGWLGLLSPGRMPDPVVPYPDGYREWSHVKSGLIGSAHPRFADMGGFQHVYANAAGLAGYRSRTFPEARRSWSTG